MKYLIHFSHLIVVNAIHHIATTIYMRVLYDNRVVWIKLEGIEGGNIGFACVYAPNIPTERRHLWHIMVESLPKDCEWIICGHFSMI